MDDKQEFKVGIYLRLSDEDRDKKTLKDDSESIKNQRNLLLEEINKRNNFVLVDEYCDEDLSGAGTYRPQFERLINDCKLGKIDVVMCKSQSRFSRDMEIIERYIHNKFIEWNVRFIGVTDNADTENSGNKKARQINGLVNEWYLEDVSNNIRSAFKAKMRQGEYISPFASYGYEVSKENNNKLVVDLVAAEIVKKIYNLYLSGYGFMGIAKYLNDRNIESPSLYKYHKGIKLNVVSNKNREDIKWSSNAIKTILTNEVYLGHLIQGKRTTVSYKNHKIKNKYKNEWIKVKNTHEAIIDEDTFKKVQYIMNKKNRSIKKDGRVHIFSSKVYCLECGRILRKKNTSKYQYLVCSSEGSGCRDCNNNKSIRYDDLEKIILNKINNFIDKYFNEELLIGNIRLEYENTFNNKIDEMKNKREFLSKEYDKFNDYLKKIYEDRLEENISLEQFRILVQDYDEKKCECENSIKEIDEEIFLCKDNINYIDLVNKYRNVDKLNRVIVFEFIDKIYIGKLDGDTRNIEIKWNL